MKLPFVWRSLLDAERERVTAHVDRINQRLEDVIHAHDREIREERTRYDALLEKFTALRLAGAVDAPPLQPPREPAKPDPVLSAIVAKAKNSIPLRTHYINYAAQQRQANVSEADVERTHQYVKGLMHGIDVLQARKAMKTA